MDKRCIFRRSGENYEVASQVAAMADNLELLWQKSLKTTTHKASSDEWGRLSHPPRSEPLAKMLQRQLEEREVKPDRCRTSES